MHAMTQLRGAYDCPRWPFPGHLSFSHRMTSPDSQSDAGRLTLLQRQAKAMLSEKGVGAGPTDVAAATAPVDGGEGSLQGPRMSA